MKEFLLRIAGGLASQRSVGLFAAAVLLLVRIWDPYPLEDLRLRGFDLYQNLHPRVPDSRPVVIVDIDEDSLKAYGQWPWPRTIVADLLTRLNEMGSVAVGFDVVFAERDRSSPEEAVRYFRGIDQSTSERLSELPSNDAVLADVIRRGKVVLGQSGTHNVDTRSAEKLPATGFAVLGPAPTPYLIAFPHLLRNLPELERAAAGRGLFSIGTERDGIVRRVPIVMQVDDRIIPGLALELLRVVSGSGAILIRSDEAGLRSVAVPGLELPTDRNGRIWINFSPHDKARYVSAKDVIQGQVSPQAFAGKLVLVGTSAIGLLDLKTTPIDAAMPGVEVHAQLIEAALSGSLLSSPSYAVVVEMLGTIVVSSALSLLAPVTGALVLFGSAIVAAVVFAGASWIAYSHYQMLFDATFPLITLFAVYMSVIGMGYFREQIGRQRIRSAFAQYLSPTLVERLAKSPRQLVLGGEDRVITVLFSDVRGFTTIAETYKDDPQGLTVLMNRLLTPLTNAIMARNGTIDKYIGDAVMAFWNAPLDDPTHEIDACHAALDMLDKVAILNAEREREAAGGVTRFVPIEIGIGLNTGRCTVGNMGSDLRFQYTAMGDTVNLASRLEAQTKPYRLPIIIGSKTAAAVADHFALLQIDSIRVKGKIEPEVIFTVIGRAIARTDAFEALASQWSQVLVCYRKQDWTGALSLIELCRPRCEAFGLAGLLDAYVDRIRRLQRDPPPADWDGVFTMESK